MIGLVPALIGGGGAGGAVDLGILAWCDLAAEGDVTVVTPPPQDGSTIITVRDKGPNDNDATQATSGQRPALETAEYPGLWLVDITADRHLRLATGAVKCVLVAYVPVAAGTLVAQDTGATTTLPAFRVRLT